MAWTAPRTWVTGEVVTAAIMNTHIRDNLKAIGDPWTAYTPTWSGGSVLGTGTLVGKYLQVGKMVTYRISLAMGSTTTYGAAGWSFSLPVAPFGTDRHSAIGIALDASPAQQVTISGLSSGSSVFLACPPITAGNYDRAVLNTQPFTWANGDQLYMTGTYEAA